MTKKNPWLGLASYEEPKNDGNDYLFCGRDEETLDVVRLIDNNLFVTLYGSSGIGKTSLLRAGVIPILRRKDYFPLYVRLSQEPKEISYAEAIVRKLQNSGLAEEIAASMKHPDGNDRFYLWNYFAITRFFNEGREVYPVIILDQFEEVFREGDKAKAELLLKQIYLLLNDELEMPDEAGYSSDTNYRFVASIREDFLFVLEDSIDENSLDLYKNNRYRLRPMKPEQARQVVLVPGKDCIEESEKDGIVERVVDLARHNKGNVIDTLLLSLVCCNTYERKTNEKLSCSDFAFWGDNPMRIYYQEAIRLLEAEQVRYLQKNLIQRDGSRKRIPEQILISDLGVDTCTLLLKGSYRILTLISEGQVELLHDQLALAIFEDRDAYEERERNWKYMEMQSQFVAEKAKSIINENSYLARLLALEVLPKNLNNPERPYTAAAESALREANDHESAILIGHTSSVHCATFSHDGKRIVSASRDKSIIVWDSKSGAKLRIINAHDGLVSSVSFSPDDKYILSASDDKTLKLFDSDTYSLLRVFIGHKAPIHAATISPNGKYVVSSSQDNTIIIWDLQTGKQINVIIGDSIERPNDRLPVAYSPEGKYIVYAIKENKIVIWNAWKGCIERVLDGHGNRVTSISFSSNGKYILSSSYDKTIKIWNAKTGKLDKVLLGHKNRVLSAALSQDNRYIVSASFDGRIIIWNASSGEEEVTLRGHDAMIHSVAFSPDGNMVVSASRDSTVRLWDSFRIYKKLIQNDKTTYSSKGVIETYDRLAVSPKRNDIEICDILSGETVMIIRGHTSDVVSVSFSPNGKYLVSASRDGIVKVWRVTGQTLLWSFNARSKRIKSVCFSSDTSRIIVTNNDGGFSAWCFPPPLQELIDQTRERFKDRPLTPEERRMYYLE